MRSRDLTNQKHKATNFIRGLIRLMRHHHVTSISANVLGEIEVTGEDFGFILGRQAEVKSSGEVPGGISIEDQDFEYKHTL